MTVLRQSQLSYTGLTADTKPLTYGGIATLTNAKYLDTQLNLEYTFDGAAWNLITTKGVTETLVGKTLTSPIISSISNTGTVTLPTATDTLVGKATTDILINKTIDATGTGNAIQNTFTSPFYKKQGAHYPRGNISTSTSGLLGGLNANASSGTGIVTASLLDTNGCGTTCDSGATINSISGWRTTSFTCRLYNCTLSYRFILTQTTACRIFLGFSSGSGSNPASNSDYLNALSGAGLWFDDGVSANWKFMHNDGTGASVVDDTTTAADTSVHTVTVTATQTPSFIIALDGVTMTNGTATADIPASGTSIGTVMYIENTTGSSKTLKYYKLFVQSDL